MDGAERSRRRSLGAGCYLRATAALGLTFAATALIAAAAPAAPGRGGASEGTVTLAVHPDGWGWVKSEDGKINCPSPDVSNQVDGKCSESFRLNQEILLTAQPAGKKKFLGWNCMAPECWRLKPAKQGEYSLTMSREKGRRVIKIRTAEYSLELEVPPAKTIDVNAPFETGQLHLGSGSSSGGETS